MDTFAIVEDILKHHGIKGMHWGVRRGRPGGGASSRKVVRKDKKFEKRANTLNQKIELHNATGPEMDKFLEKHNTKWAKQIDRGDLINENGAPYKKYLGEYMKEYVKQLNVQADKMGLNASGTRRYAVTENNDLLGFTVFTTSVKHASNSESFSVKVIRNNKGAIIRTEIKKNSMAQSAIKHISEKPWSDYTEADYTIEQWHAACLIHLHDGSPTSKSQCKLPVKTPNGALNRNGVHAAAAALAGARSPLKAPPDQKAKAANALRRYYSQLGETPPDSLKQSAIVNDILTHHGVKGMRWGIRRNSNHPLFKNLRNPFPRREVHPDAAVARTIKKKKRKGGVSSLSNQEIQAYTHRLNLESNLKSAESRKSKHKTETLKLLGEVGKITVKEAAKTEAGKKVGAQLRARVKAAMGK